MATTHRQSNQQPADVLVVFGISGDLAKVMTFRSLYRLERRGLLNCPIVGVAVDDWTTDDLRQHARKAIEATGEPVDEAVFDRFAGRLSYLSGDFGDPATYERVGAAIGQASTPVFYLEIPPFLFGTVVKGLADAGLTERRPGGGGEAVRPRPRLGPRPQRRGPQPHRRVAALPDRPLPGQDGPGRDPLPPLRQHDAGAGLEPPARGVRADHHGRELRRRGPRPLLRPGRRAPGRGRQPPDAGGGGGGDGAAGRRRPRHAQGRHGRRLPGHAGRRPGPLRPRPVRRLPVDRGGGRRLDHRDLRRPAPGDRQLALVGRAVLHPHRQVPAGHPDRAAGGLQATRPGWASGRRASSSRSRARW